MKIGLNCPHAMYDEKMMIFCTKDEDVCVHQRFKPCKGFYVLTPDSEECPVRDDMQAKGDSNG